MADRLVRVAVPRPVDAAWTWSVPAFFPDLRLGHAVSVPLGASIETGWVLGAGTYDGLNPAKVRQVQALLDPVPVFDEAQLGFFQWIADYYLVPLGMVLATALPGRGSGRGRRVLEATDAGHQALAEQRVGTEALAVLRALVARRGITVRQLADRIADEVAADGLARLVAQGVKQGWWAWDVQEGRGFGGQVATVTLTRPAAVVREAVGRAPRQLTVVQALEAGTLDVDHVVRALGATARPALTALARAGHVVRGTRERRDPLLEHEVAPSFAPSLNPDQQAAIAAIAGSTRPTLLYGVTGSGKTEVFLGATAAVLEQGRQVLVLVPEIGLTPQLVGRFRARFGDGVAVLHSGLTGAQRLGQWRRVRAGEASVVVGARSALFAPFARLGLVVVDEEHDDSYKQDDGVPYHARDLAVVLGRRAACPVVLASATPSLESWHNALEGRYARVDLPQRATPRPLPDVLLLDRAEEVGPEGAPRPVLMREAVDALREAIASGGQAVVLYNRRGWATLVSCEGCGASYACPQCAIEMTLHKGTSELVCHWCALRVPFTGSCPRCGSADLDLRGQGTERIADAVREALPGVEVLRMDADTTAVRGSHARLLDRFREGEAGVLLGTQMIAKGHDFPDVRVVVVVSADQPLRLPDFRAAERTFSLLVQVAGRAGRGDAPGRVVVQTWRPDHFAIASVTDPARFYRQEMRLRATLRYPPFARLCLVRLDGLDRDAVRLAADGLARQARRLARPHASVAVMGPAPSSAARVAGRWRFQLVLRGEQMGPFRAFLSELRPVLLTPQKGVRVAWDVDPRNLG